MKKWEIYESPPISILDDCNKVIYILEYSDRIKIGRTKHPRSRLKTHVLNALARGESIGRVAIHNVSDNYYSAERQAIELFSEKRIDATEEFKVSFDEAMTILNGTPSDNEQLRNEIERLKKELRFAKKIAEALGFDWTKFYEETHD